MTAIRCPKFEDCSAPVCPLDADWRKRRHLHGERVCLWLRELVKPHGVERVAEGVGRPLALALVETLPEVEASNSDIRHKLQRAAATGTKRRAAHGL
jgi:hypothetical protein